MTNFKRCSTAVALALAASAPAFAQEMTTFAPERVLVVIEGTNRGYRLPVEVAAELCGENVLVETLEEAITNADIVYCNIAETVALERDLDNMDYDNNGIADSLENDDDDVDSDDTADSGDVDEDGDTDNGDDGDNETDEQTDDVTDEVEDINDDTADEGEETTEEVDETTDEVEDTAEEVDETTDEVEDTADEVTDDGDDNN